MIRTTARGAVALAGDGRLVYTAGYGEANLDYGIPNGPGIVYSSGSVSKQFTSRLPRVLRQN